MALATENANLVWQKVKMALMNANPTAQNAFLDLKMYLATQKRNPNLQFVPFAGADLEGAAGLETIVGGACTLYGVYAASNPLKVGSTVAFFQINDAADNDTSTTTVLTARFNALAQSYSVIIPTGQPLATDLTISAVTAVGGGTASAAGDGQQGFVVIGA